MHGGDRIINLETVNTHEGAHDIGALILGRSITGLAPL